jgi:hypothetical protein
VPTMAVVPNCMHRVEQTREDSMLAEALEEA